MPIYKHYHLYTSYELCNECKVYWHNTVHSLYIQTKIITYWCIFADWQPFIGIHMTTCLLALQKDIIKGQHGILIGYTDYNTGIITS